MELTGRITADAAVKRTQDGRELVAFTVVDNHHYKTKGGEKKDDASFFSCAYWLGTGIAPHLKKGAIVTVTGHAGINLWKNKEGDFFAHLTFHANNVKIIAKAKSTSEAATTTAPEHKEDLPF